MALAGVCVAPVGTLMTRVVQFDGGEDCGIWFNDQEVERKLAEFVLNARIAPTAPEAQGLQELHLCQDDVLRKGLD